MTWHTGPLALFDLETTGVDPHRDRIVTATIIHITPGQRPIPATWLINPGIPIPEPATRIHGITTQHAEDHGHNPADATRAIAAMLLAHTFDDTPVVGHNVSFDLTMLWAELVRHGHTMLADQVRTIRPVVDTMILDKWVDPWRPKEPTARRKDPAKCGSRRLLDTARVWGLPVDEDQAHGSEYDALLAGRVAWKICEATPGATAPAGELHDTLVGLAREQGDSLGAWLVKSGKLDDARREWPVESPPVGWSSDQLPEPRNEEVPA